MMMLLECSFSVRKLCLLLHNACSASKLPISSFDNSIFIVLVPSIGLDDLPATRAPVRRNAGWLRGSLFAPTIGSNGLSLVLVHRFFRRTPGDHATELGTDFQCH